MLNREEEYWALYKVMAQVEKPPETIIMPLYKYSTRDKTPEYLGMQTVKIVW